MDVKKIVAFLLLILVILVFSGCAGGSSVKTGSGQEDKTGYGLKATLKFDTRWISSGKVNYELTLVNSGVNTVTITQGDNFKLTTKMKLEGANLFTDDSINNFYSRVFQNGNDITLGHDQTITVAGVLQIRDDVLASKTIDSFDYVLQIIYHYKTEFNNNIHINTEFKTSNLMTVKDSVSQAAPVQVTSLELIPGTTNTDYDLLFGVEDKAKSYSSSVQPVQIDNIVFSMGNAQLSGCTPWTKESSNQYKTMDSPKLSSEFRNLVMRCQVSIDEGKDYDTKVFGSFEYDYKIVQTGTVNLPKIQDNMFDDTSSK